MSKDTTHAANIAMAEIPVDCAPAYAELLCNDPRATAGVAAGTGVGADTGAIWQTDFQAFNLPQTRPRQQSFPLKKGLPHVFPFAAHDPGFAGFEHSEYQSFIFEHVPWQQGVLSV